MRQRYLEQYDLAVHFAAFRRRKLALFERRFAMLPTPIPGRDRLIDIGCADGQFLEAAGRRGWTVFGVELNPPAAAAAEAGGATVFRGELESMEHLPWGTFDLVTGWDVLEHTPEPRAFMERMVRLAAPGATIAISTLNVRSAVARCFGMRWSLVIDDHFTYWSERSLKSFVEDFGVEVAEVSTAGIGRDFFLWADGLQRRLRPRRSKPDAAAGTSSGLAAERRWDSVPAVLAVEGGVNRVLRATGAGVDVHLIGTVR